MTETTVIRPFGEAALLVELTTPDDAQALHRSLHAAPVAGVTGSVPGLSSLLVEFDPLTSTAADIAPAIAARARGLGAAPAAEGRLRVIPVVYGGHHGPDLDAVAAILGLASDEVVAMHAALELRVLFDGFAPGWAYLGELPDALRVARLETPRTRTARGSVGIAGAMSGIYPADLPGGWRIIGRTPIELFDPLREPPAYLLPGDRVRFESIHAGAWDERAGAPEDW